MARMGDKDQLIPPAVRRLAEERWRLGVLIFWLGLSAWLLIDRSGTIDHFFLRDTDDNMRLAQVRALLDGQGWHDLRQYRILPPDGANIHWSRLVDLPLAGLILLFDLFLPTLKAEAWAAATAPLVPMLLALIALALITRRILGKAAWPLAMVAFLFASIALGMFFPMRIDHHGWQLALLLLAFAGLVDPNTRRGGLTAGLAAGLSLTIGLEMIIFLSLLGFAMVLGWVADRAERGRMLAFAATLAATTSFGFLLFASADNLAMRCDALTPVWLADAILGSALLLLIGWRGHERWTVRLAMAAAAGLLLAAFHALAFPHCLSRLEGVPEAVSRQWLDLVNEARPVTRHSLELQLRALSIPLIGAIGYTLMIVSARRDPRQLRATLSLAVPAFVGLGLLFWQLRAAPAAQLLAVPGAVGLIWLLLPRLSASGSLLVRTLGVAALVVIGLGALPSIVAQYVPKNEVQKALANSKRITPCTANRALEPLGEVPPGLMFVHIDLGPRLIVMTPHDAITGPYHRNHQAIGDVLTALSSPPEQARPIIDRYGADYLLICDDNKAQQRTRARRRLADALERQVPDWLEPVDLPEESPFRLFRVKGSESSR
ncbi:AcrB/AcrD/AcrF family protein [Sphingomicrobium lutaoense]|nr:AcrB/AcrD/AcrF family protein [Sphingomicrobium lutaoense]